MAGAADGRRLSPTASPRSCRPTCSRPSTWRGTSRPSASSACSSSAPAPTTPCLLISRYRDELKTTESRHEAMAHALSRTFEAVLSSSTTVVLGLLTLLLSAIPTTRGLGLACAVGVVIAATFALVVLPAALVLFGRWVFWPRVPHVGDAVLVDSRGVWRRVGDAVARRPRDLRRRRRWPGWRSCPSARRPSRPASTRPTSSCSSPRPSRPRSGWASRSRPARATPSRSSPGTSRRRSSPRWRRSTASTRRASPAPVTASRASTPCPTPTPGSDEAKQVVLDVRDGGRRLRRHPRRRR